MDPETKQMIPEKDYVMKYVMSKHPEETKKLLQSGDLMDIYGGDLYNALFDYMSEEMPYGTQKARDGDPYVWIADELDDLGLLDESSHAGLRAWFGKGKKGGAGGGGWDRYNTKGERIGKCGEGGEDEGKPKCLSRSKAAKMSKKDIGNAVRRKRKVKQGVGGKPTNVKTFAKKKRGKNK